MLSEEQLQDFTKLLGEGQVQRVQSYSVWREQQRYSDERLWARLYELYDRKIAILRQLPLIYRLAHSDLKDRLFWHGYWFRLVLELEADKPVKKAYSWHLSQRGDAYVSQWLEECEEYKRCNSQRWQRAAWGIEDE